MSLNINFPSPKTVVYVLKRILKLPTVFSLKLYYSVFLDSNGAQISPTQNADETQHDSAAYSEIQREISDEELPVYRCPSDPPPLYRSRAGTSIDGNIGSHVQPDSAVAFDNPDIPEENFYIQIGEISNNDGFRTPQSGSVLS